MTDPQYAALNTIVEVDDEELGGPVQMQNVLFRLSESLGRSVGRGDHMARTQTQYWLRSGSHPSSWPPCVTPAWSSVRLG